MRASMLERARFLVAFWFAIGCRTGQSSEAKSEAPAASASAVPSSSAKRIVPIRSEDLPPELRVATSWPIPAGPVLAILAGQGVGPIHLGANVATIERLMELPCEIRTEDACRYIGRGVEFFLKNGVTTEIRVHRAERPTEPKPRKFGIFNGRTPEGVAPMMLPAGVEELLGKPAKIEKVGDGGEAHTVEVYYYKGMRIEFDQMPNGTVALGGFIIGGNAGPPPRITHSSHGASPG